MSETCHRPQPACSPNQSRTGPQRAGLIISWYRPGQESLRATGLAAATPSMTSRASRQPEMPAVR